MAQGGMFKILSKKNGKRMISDDKNNETIKVTKVLQFFSNTEPKDAKLGEIIRFMYNPGNGSILYWMHSRSSSLGVNAHAGSMQAEFQQKLSHYDSTLLYSTQLETEKQDKQKNGNSKEMTKQVLLLQKNPARPDVMPLANGNDVFTIASLMGQFLPPPPSLGDYIFSMRT